MDDKATRRDDDRAVSEGIPSGDDLSSFPQAGRERMILEAGQDEKIVIACLLHDISNGALLRTEPR